MSMKINYISYRWMVQKQNWRVMPFDQNIEVPVSMLWFSLFVSEFFICLFAFICMDNDICSYSLVTVISIANIVYIFWNIQNKKRAISSKDS
eukprot:13653_1